MYTQGTGQVAAAGGKAANDGKIAESNEVFPEEKVLAESAEDQENIEQNFKNTPEYKTLTSIVPATLNIGDLENPLETNISLCERIVVNYVNLKRSNGGTKGTFEKYSKEYLGGHDMQDVSPESQDNLILKLAIIESCNDPSIIALEPEDSHDLAFAIFERLPVEISYTNDGNIETNEKEVSFLEDPAYPILKRLLDEGIISTEDFALLDRIYEKEGSFHDIREIENYQVIQDYLTLALSDESGSQEKNRKAFTKDFPESDIEVNPSMSFDEQLLTRANVLTSNNYISIIKKDGTIDRQADISVAIKVASKKLLQGDYSINKNSEVFKKAIAHIETGNTDLQQQGLATLIFLKGMSAGKFGKKDSLHLTKVEQLLKKNYQEGEKKQLAKAENLAAIRAAEEQDRREELDSVDTTAQAANDSSFGQDLDTPMQGGDKKMEVGSTESNNIKEVV